jgi:putative hydrolases of HD superfamily
MDAELLADTNPFPTAIAERLRQQLTFLIEIDRLKTVLRQSPLAAVDRRENDAEHSWHLAMMVVVLAEHSDEQIDVGHTLELVLLHEFQPLLLNWMARGGTWQTPGVTADDIRARKAVIGDASTSLWEAGRELIDEGERRGWSRPGR